MSRPLLMGILNVTPDSFSDGGRWNLQQAAIDHARQLWADGATIIDVGGESTRPSATRISADQEWSRISEIIPVLVDEGIFVSVDTVNSSTARRALKLGVRMINDISGGCYDREMAAVVADSNSQFVIQHWRGFPSQPGRNLKYENPVVDALRETKEQIDRAMSLGVRSGQIVIDPGLGFGLNNEDSWRTVDNLESWVLSGYPVLVGASRKRFLRVRYGDQLNEGTLDVTTRCVESNVWAIRVHDVLRNRARIDGPTILGQR